MDQSHRLETPEKHDSQARLEIGNSRSRIFPLGLPEIHDDRIDKEGELLQLFAEAGRLVGLREQDRYQVEVPEQFRQSLPHEESQTGQGATSR